MNEGDDEPVPNEDAEPAADVSAGPVVLVDAGEDGGVAGRARHLHGVLAEAEVGLVHHLGGHSRHCGTLKRYLILEYSVI